MSGRVKGFIRSVALFEAGAAIIFFGSLMHRPDLAEQGAKALRELGEIGYEIPRDSSPIRIYPADGSNGLDSAHAGAWRPGVVSLRENPKGNAGPEVYLRHELMHEASFRTCGGKLPLWAEEAAAIHFSGELAEQPAAAGPPTASELDCLRNRVRTGARLDPASYAVLARLVAAYGWPREPCSTSKEIAGLIGSPDAAGSSGFSYVLMSLVSGRIFESRGDLETKYPPGSLLKIPYAAALGSVSREAAGEELAASDTTRLLKRRTALDIERYRLLVSAAGDSPLGRLDLGGLASIEDERLWRQYLGERGPDGNFPFEADLRGLALVMRASLLSQSSRFSGLSENGFAERSTLYPAPEEEKAILRKLRALSKTGTVSDERGSPVAGHLMVAWPAEDPAFLAVFRTAGASGASNLRLASKVLEKWSLRYPAQLGKVRVRLLTLVPRSSWEIADTSPSFEIQARGGRKDRVSLSGGFGIVSSAKGSRSERLVRGVLESSPDGEQVVLITDPESYADAVLDSEAGGLRGESRKAMRAAIFWNGTHGEGRHRETLSLCDTTHCMVFLGSLPEESEKPRDLTDPNLLKLLDRLAAEMKCNWLPFSKGGNEKWERATPAAELDKLVGESAVLDIRRERRRSGEVAIHLIYPESEEVVPCEVFRGKLKLPSCPEAVVRDEGRGGWVFEGLGEGHGRGLSVEKARALGEAGWSAGAILEDAYKKLPEN